MQLLSSEILEKIIIGIISFLEKPNQANKGTNAQKWRQREGKSL